MHTDAYEVGPLKRLQSGLNSDHARQDVTQDSKRPYLIMLLVFGSTLTSPSPNVQHSAKHCKYLHCRIQLEAEGGWPPSFPPLPCSPTPPLPTASTPPTPILHFFPRQFLPTTSIWWIDPPWKSWICPWPVIHLWYFICITYVEQVYYTCIC